MDEPAAEDDLEELRVAALVEHMTAHMLMSHFLDLAAAFAVVDAAAAAAAIRAIEHDMARGLTQLRDEFIKGPGGNHVLGPVAERLRDTIMTARERMAQAVKPN